MNLKTNNELSFFLQARLGSTRLPNKVLLPFYKQQSILSLLIKRLKLFSNIDLILVTSDLERDNPLIELAKKENIKYYRGSDNDVLKRFIDAANFIGCNDIIRICCDNPFLDLESIQTLISYKKASKCDYISFKINNKPAITTHFGFWSEFVTLDALKKIQNYTDDIFYHEHVTNYIYTNPQKFTLRWINAPTCLCGREDIRLTIDTFNDFKNIQQIYSEIYLNNKNIQIKDIIKYLNNHPEYLLLMKEEIKRNFK